MTRLFHLFGSTAQLCWTASPDAETQVIYRQAPGETRMSCLCVVSAVGFNDTLSTPGCCFYRVFPRRVVDGNVIVGRSDRHVCTYTWLRWTSSGEDGMMRAAARLPKAAVVKQSSTGHKQGAEWLKASNTFGCMRISQGEDHEYSVYRYQNVSHEVF
ncbi:MAG: hypothetical protein QM270_02460 [Bacillota bacterium]|nr:hypothetical protein [Bacillota bacterium]